MNYMNYLSKDGINVFVHPEASHSHRPDLDEEAISKITIGNRPFIRETIDLARTIGFDHLIETTEEDTIIGFRRGDQKYESRMVLGRKAEPTSKVTLIICKCDDTDGEEWDGKYVLVTLFEGDPGQPEPYGRNEDNQEAIEFWRHHALVPTEAELAVIKNGKPSPSGMYIVSYWQCNEDDEYYGSSQQEVFNSYKAATEYAMEIARDVLNRNICVYTSFFNKGRLETKEFIISYEEEYERCW